MSEPVGQVVKLDEAVPILVVDAQNDMRMIVAHQLQKLNFKRVLQAGTGMEALDHLRAHPHISVVVCSMELPDMTGLELLAEIREIPEIERPPFCVTMSNVSKDKIMFAIESGVDEILVKPYTLGDIIPKIRKAHQSFHNPKNPEKMYEFAKSFLRSGSLDDADKVYTKLHEAAPLKARPLVGRARIAVKRDDFATAYAYLVTAEKNNPNYVHLFTVRGDIFLKEKKFADAIKSYRQAIELSPLNPFRYVVVGGLLLEVEKYQELVELLSIAIQKNVEFAKIYQFLGQAYYYLKDYKSAIKFLRKSTDREPENTTYINQLAIAHKESGDLEEAQKLYNRVIKLDPDNLQALFNKAIMLAQKDQKAEAIKILERVVEKHPEFEKAKNKLEELRKA